MKRRSWASTARPCCAGCFCNVRHDDEVPRDLDDLHDGVDAERPDQLVLEVGLADVEPDPLHPRPCQIGAETGALQPAPEQALLGGVAQPGQPEVQTGRSDHRQETSDVGGSADRHDGDAFLVEAPSPAPGEGFQRHLVTDALGENDCPRFDGGGQRRTGRDHDGRALAAGCPLDSCQVPATRLLHRRELSSSARGGIRPPR